MLNDSVNNYRIIQAIDLDNNNLASPPTEGFVEAGYFLDKAYAILVDSVPSEFTLSKEALFGYTCLIKAESIFLCKDDMKKEYFLALYEIFKGKEIINPVKDIDTVSLVILESLEALQEEISNAITVEMQSNFPLEV